jgi:hypothetical protein
MSGHPVSRALLGFAHPGTAMRRAHLRELADHVFSHLMCTCCHSGADHERGAWACHGLDSYGIRCTCESLELDIDDPAEDDEG